MLYILHDQDADLSAPSSYIFISASQPAGRLRFISESIVLGVGSKISIRRFVNPHFKLFTAFFIDMRAFNDRVKVLLSGRKWNWSSNRSAGSKSCINNLLSGLIDNSMIISFKTNSDPLFSLGLSSFL